MSTARLEDAVNRSDELLARVKRKLKDRLHAMRDAMSGLPGAGSFEGDRTSGHTTTTDEHGMSVPAVSDPTGEAAIRPDKARDDRRQLERHLLTAVRALDAADVILDRYQPRSASDRERAETTKQNESKPGCIICAQTEIAPGIKRFDYIISDQRCRWHLDFRRDTGRDATPQETDQHARGVKVRRPA